MKITDPIAAPSPNASDEELQEFFEHVALILSYRFIGVGTPEGSITAPVGAIYQRLDGGSNTTLYVKESGTGNTGWAAK